MYDYLIVGAGLFGSICARELSNAGYKVLVIDKRNHIGGNAYTERNAKGINIHKYGPHIFHTNSAKAWEYMNAYTVFNRFTNNPVANYKDEIYSLPFNMTTFNQMWGVKTPQEAMKKIEKQTKEIKHVPRNLEEKAISMVGRDIYKKLIKGYTEKQWGKKCKDLPESIIKRLPLRFNFDNNYFNAMFQGIPKNGYTKMFEALLYGIDVELNLDFEVFKESWRVLAKNLIYTGPIDEYFGYVFGTLEYRSVAFREVNYDQDNFQGNAVVNYTHKDIKYTRSIEHKWFEYGSFNTSKAPSGTTVSFEYSEKWEKGMTPYYPINDDKNQALYNKYLGLAKNESNVCFGGRLGTYSYKDMDVIVLDALELVESLIGGDKLGENK